MRSSVRGAQSFNLVNPIQQTDTYEIWDCRSTTGQPATMVLLPQAAATVPSVRSAFGAAVAWAVRVDNAAVTVLAEDALGVTPWAALAPDPQGGAVRGFVERFMTPLTSSGPIDAEETVQVPAASGAGRPEQTPEIYEPAIYHPHDRSPESGPPASPWEQIPQPVWGPSPRQPTSGPPATAAEPFSVPPADAGNSADPVSPAWWNPADSQVSVPPVGQPWSTPHPAPVRSPDVPPLPAPGQWPSQQRRSRKRLTFVLTGIAVVLIAAAAAGFFVLPGLGKSAGGGPTAAPSQTVPPSPQPSGTPLPSFQPSAAPVVVAGTSWQPGDETKILAFDNWPFAFRIFADATCQFYSDKPDDKAQNCRRGVEPQHTVMAFVVRRCVNGCDAAERAVFETKTPWKPDAQFTASDETTQIAEADYGDRVQLTMLHYFGTSPGGPLTWVVTVQGNTPKPQRDLVLKTINDIRSQTP